MLRRLLALIRKIRSLITLRLAYLLGVLVVAGAVLAFELTNAHQKQVAAMKAASAHQQLATKSTPVATPKPTQDTTPAPQAALVDQPAATPTTAAPANKSTLAPKPVPAPQPQTVDFTLSPSTITVAQGADSPALQAISAGGQPIWWGVLGGNGITVTEGMTSNSAEAVHTFKLHPSPSVTPPGTYSMNIMGYIPHGPSVTKQLTIIVTPMTATPQN